MANVLFRHFHYINTCTLEMRKIILLYCTAESVVVAIHLRALSWTYHSWKRRIYRLKCDAIYRSFRDISTSGLGGHIAISGCLSSSKSSEGTFVELATVKNLDLFVCSWNFNAIYLSVCLSVCLSIYLSSSSLSSGRRPSRRSMSSGNLCGPQRW